MKKQEFSKEFLTELKNTLPYGAQAKIAQKLSTPESPITLNDVRHALEGKGLHPRKCDPNLIIMEAIAICKTARATQQEVKQAAEEFSNGAEKQ